MSKGKSRGVHYGSATKQFVPSLADETSYRAPQRSAAASNVPPQMREQVDQAAEQRRRMAAVHQAASAVVNQPFVSPDLAAQVLGRTLRPVLDVEAFRDAMTTHYAATIEAFRQAGEAASTLGRTARETVDSDAVNEVGRIVHDGLLVDPAGFVQRTADESRTAPFTAEQQRSLERFASGTSSLIDRGLVPARPVEQLEDFGAEPMELTPEQAAAVPGIMFDKPFVLDEMSRRAHEHAEAKTARFNELMCRSRDDLRALYRQRFAIRDKELRKLTKSQLAKELAERPL